MEGHAGLDYGSGMPLIAHVPELNLSYALATNSGEGSSGMNTSMGTLENSNVIGAIYCPLLDAVVHAQLPEYPAFNCNTAQA